jgi:thymidine kinase
MATLTFRYGAMGCGKTAGLLQVAYNYNERGFEVALMKPSLDTKATGDIVTRIGLSRPTDHLITERENIYKTVANHFPTIHCLLIDEAQFLPCRQIDQLQEIAILLDIPVLAYGLRCDSMQKSWPGSRRLLEIADHLEEIPTLCDCGGLATLNTRFLNGELQTSGPKILIDDGTTEIVYKSLCPACWHKAKRKIKHSTTPHFPKTVFGK